MKKRPDVGFFFLKRRNENAVVGCPRNVLRSTSVLGRKGGFEIGDGGVNLGKK